jgi:beta-glucosidase
VGFVDNTNVTALIFAHLPGQDSGKAIAAILFGDANPSGKLPYTVAKKAEDYATADPDLPEENFANFPQSNFDEGVFVDYRRFDKEDVEPRFEFGFGLSYTTFDFSNPRVNMSSNASLDEYPSGKVIQGGMEDLWDVLVAVSADIVNSGETEGAEVAQLYIGIPGDETPAKQLRGFEKSFLNATEKATVEFGLTRRDLSVWDTEKQLWRLQRGKYGVFVGRSSRDLPLSSEFEI